MIISAPYHSFTLPPNRKPENVLVSMEREGSVLRPVYKLGDFGLVRLANLKEDFLHDLEGGDGRYVSPELMQGDASRLQGNLELSDIWSVGCTIYAMARQRDLPTGGDEYAEIRAGKVQLSQHKYSTEFVALLKKMINPDLRARMPAAALLREPLLQTEEARECFKAVLKRCKLEKDVEEKDKEIELLQLELQLARDRERVLADELQRARVDASHVEARLNEIFAAVCFKNATGGAGGAGGESGTRQEM